MTKKEFRESKEYADMMKKVKSYPAGFEFSIPYYQMRQGQKNAMYVFTQDCIKAGLLQSMSMDVALLGEITSEKFKKI